MKIKFNCHFINCMCEKHLTKDHCGQIHLGLERKKKKKKKTSSVNAFEHYEECNETNKLHLHVLNIFWLLRKKRKNMLMRLF